LTVAGRDMLSGLAKNRGGQKQFITLSLSTTALSIPQVPATKPLRLYTSKRHRKLN
jgi:hypothetical protein